MAAFWHTKGITYIANKEVRDIDPGRTRTMRLGSDFSAVGEQDARLRECGDGSAGTNANVYVRGPTHPAGRLFVGLVRGRLDDEATEACKEVWVGRAFLGVRMTALVTADPASLVD